MSRQHRANINTIRPPSATEAYRRTRVIASPGGKFPTLFQTALGLDVTILNTDGGYAAAQQAARLEAFLQNDEKAYAPPAPRTTNRYAVVAGWHEVDSTSIAALKWDPDRQSLTVEFQSNRARYRYDRVPERVVHELLHAPSVGSYFEGQIKRHYASTKLPE